jgi:membrane protein DedA with SNARE-associated domain
MERLALDWLVYYGAPLLFFAQLFGIFGLPIPDELLLTVAGALVRSGRLNLTATIAAATAGCMCGITISYILGRLVGLALVASRLRLHQTAITRAQRWFQRFGPWLLAFGYFIPGVRHVTAIAAGSAPLDSATFARYAYPGAVLWCGVFLTAGYYAGDRWRDIAPFTHAHLLLMAVAATAAVAAVFVVHRRVHHRRIGE